MIEVNLSDEDILKQARDITLFKYRYYTIVALVSLVFAFLCIIFFKRFNYGFYNVGISIDFILFLYFMFILDSYFRLKKVLIKNFDKNYQMGIKILNIELTKDSIDVTDKILAYTEKIEIKNIKKCYKFLSVIMIKLNDKTYKFIPNKKEIVQFINNNIEK